VVVAGALAGQSLHAANSEATAGRPSSARRE